MAKKIEKIENVEKADVKETAPVFTKEQFIKSNTYRQHKDLLVAVLDDTKTYSKEQVNNIINKFKGKVGK